MFIILGICSKGADVEAFHQQSGDGGGRRRSGWERSFQLSDGLDAGGRDASMGRRMALSIMTVAIGRGGGPRCSDFWRPGETGAVAWWLAGRREASGLSGAAEVGLILGASWGRKFRQGPQSLSENSKGSCFRGKAGLARREERAYPQWSVSDEQRRQSGFYARTLRAAGLLPVAFVGSALTARVGDARALPPWPQPKSPAAGPAFNFQTGSYARPAG